MKLARRPRTWFGEDEVTAEIYLLGSLIQRPVVSVMESAPLMELHRLLVELHVPAIAVIDDTHTLRGLVTRTDVLRAVFADPKTATARDVMSTFVFTVPADSTIEAAAALIANENIGQVAVTADDGELVGMVSAVDIARHLARRAGYLP